MELEYQLSNGSWTSVDERADYFVGLCIGRPHNGVAIGDAEQASELLRSGAVLSTGPDWYANLRATPEPRPAPARDPRAVLTCRSCGQTGRRGDYPFSTNPSSGCCDDCN